MPAGDKPLPCRAADAQADELPFIPVLPIARHGVIGDRRTAAVVAADGTINWYCLPHYGCPPIFGALLDPRRGGFWRMGPARLALGQQRYLEQSRVLLTTLKDAWGQLELTNAMA